MGRQARTFQKSIILFFISLFTFLMFITNVYAYSFTIFERDSNLTCQKSNNGQLSTPLFDYLFERLYYEKNKFSMVQCIGTDSIGTCILRGQGPGESQGLITNAITPLAPHCDYETLHIVTIPVSVVKLPSYHQESSSCQIDITKNTLKSFLLANADALIATAAQEGVEIGSNDLERAGCISDRNMGSCIVHGDAFAPNSSTTWIINITVPHIYPQSVNPWGEYEEAKLTFHLMSSEC